MSSISELESGGMEEPLGSHYEENEYLASIVPIEDAARRLNDLTIAPPSQLRQFRAALRMLGKLFHVAENALHEHGRGNRIV